MLTRTQLAEALRSANVVETAEASGVSTKTIYRIRTQPDYDPGARTMERLEAALMQGRRVADGSSDCMAVARGEAAKADA